MKRPLELRINPLDGQEYLAVEIPNVLARPKIETKIGEDKTEERYKLYEKGIMIPSNSKEWVTEHKYWMPAADVKNLGLIVARYSFPAIIISRGRDGEKKETFTHITLRQNIDPSGRKLMYFPVNVMYEINHNPTYPLQIYPIIGTETVTVPGKTITVETIRVKHLGHIFPHNINHPPVQKIGGRWIWFIPFEIRYIPPGQEIEILRPYEKFAEYIRRRYPLKAEILSDGISEQVMIDIGFVPINEGNITKEIASNSKPIPVAYRTMSNNNYSLKDEDKYPFYAELRASWLTCYPRTHHIPRAKKREYPDIMNPDTLEKVELVNREGKKGSLTITVYNMAHWVFIHEYPNGAIARPFRSKKIELYHNKRIPTWNKNWKIEDFPNKVEFSKTYGTRRGPASLEDVQLPAVISEGMEINVPVSYDIFEGFPFERVIKYARFINALNKYYAYNDSQVNEKAETRYTTVDKEGFIWKQAWLLQSEKEEEEE